MKKKSNQASTNETKQQPLPRWLLILVALVPLGALLWGAVKDTLLSPDTKPPPPPTAKPAVSAPSGPVTASGASSVAVGSMSGGLINLGAAPPKDKPVATGKP